MGFFDFFGFNAKKQQKNGYLANTRCYLGGPIENSVDENWRVSPKKVLVDEFNINLFDPFEDPKQQWVPELEKARKNKDYETMTKIASSFVRKDLAIVDRCDFIVSYLPYKVATTGTHHEIINSVNAKKPTLLVCPQGREYISTWYYGFVPHEFMFGSWEELYFYLREVDQGKYKENIKWAFVYGLI